MAHAKRVGPVPADRVLGLFSTAGGNRPYAIGWIG